MNNDTIKAAYRRYARAYDLLFGPVLQGGRKMAIKALDMSPGNRVLEVGVGTGLSLPLYPRNVNVTAIDLSEDMIAKARQCVSRKGLSNVEAVLEMDAERMTFPDNHFDKVVAMYVVSVAQSPVRLVDEMCRVCKPEGEIAIVNHFRFHNPVVKRIETRLTSYSASLGFRLDLDLDGFLKATQLEVMEMRRTNFIGAWWVLLCINRAKQDIHAKASEN